MTAGFLLEALLAVSIQASVLLLMAGRWERRLPPASRDRLWHAAQLLVVALLLLALLLPHLRWTTLPRWVSAESLPAWQRAWDAVARPLVAVLLAGGAVHIARMAWASFQTRRMLRGAKELPEFSALLHQQYPASDFARRAGVVRLANGRVGPHCWHWQRPVIVLSRRTLALSTESQRMILRHELAHLEAGHPLQAFVQRCLEAVLWFHPLIWWSSRRAELAREMRCDAPLNAEDAETYLSALLAMTQRPEEEREQHPLPIAFSRNQSLLKDRLAAFSEPLAASRAGRFAVPGLLALAIALSVFGWPPVNPHASTRTAWSPWPEWSATALKSIGLMARDYETDAHRLQRHH